MSGFSEFFFAPVCLPDQKVGYQESLWPKLGWTDSC